MTKDSKTWYKGTGEFKGWKYCQDGVGYKALSPSGRTYRVVELCQEVKTVPETQSGYLWYLRAVYCYRTLSRATAERVLTLVYGEATRRVVLEWTEHLVMIEECGPFVGQSTQRTLDKVLKEMSIDNGRK